MGRDDSGDYWTVFVRRRVNIKSELNKYKLTKNIKGKTRTTLRRLKRTPSGRGNLGNRIISTNKTSTPYQGCRYSID